MENRIKLSASTLTVNGKRAGITICGPGGWIDSVPAELIKIRCKRGCFPAAFRDALTVTNNSDSREDYFEGDTLRLMPGDALYEQAKALTA